MPKISVLIPAYNVEKYIARCLDSVIAQTFRDIEIIIVNDGSTDGTAAIIDEYAARDSRIKVINHPENCGLMWVRKTCVEASSGDYLMFVDSDDAVKPNACERLYSTAIETGADLVVAGYEHLKCNGRRVPFSSELKYGSSSYGFTKAMLENDLRRYLWSKLYERRLFVDDPLEYFKHFNLGEDQVISYQIARNVRNAVCIPDLIYEYYEYRVSLSNADLTIPKSRKLASDYLFMQAMTVKMVYKIDPELAYLAETLAIKAVRTQINAGKGNSRKVFMEIVDCQGLTSLFSIPSLFRHLGVWKGFTFFLATRIDLMSKLVH